MGHCARHGPYGFFGCEPCRREDEHQDRIENLAHHQREESRRAHEADAEYQREMLGIARRQEAMARRRAGDEELARRERQREEAERQAKELLSSQQRDGLRGLDPDALAQWSQASRDHEIVLHAMACLDAARQSLAERQEKLKRAQARQVDAIRAEIEAAWIPGSVSLRDRLPHDAKDSWIADATCHFEVLERILRPLSLPPRRARSKKVLRISLRAWASKAWNDLASLHVRVTGGLGQALPGTLSREAPRPDLAWAAREMHRLSRACPPGGLPALSPWPILGLLGVAYLGSVIPAFVVAVAIAFPMPSRYEDGIVSCITAAAVGGAVLAMAFAVLRARMQARHDWQRLLTAVAGLEAAIAPAAPVRVPAERPGRTDARARLTSLADAAVSECARRILEALPAERRDLGDIRAAAEEVEEASQRVAMLEKSELRAAARAASELHEALRREIIDVGKRIQSGDRLATSDVRFVRCSSCGSPVHSDRPTCPDCGGVLPDVRRPDAR